MEFNSVAFWTEIDFYFRFDGNLYISHQSISIHDKKRTKTKSIDSCANVNKTNEAPSKLCSFEKQRASYSTTTITVAPTATTKAAAKTSATATTAVAIIKTTITKSTISSHIRFIVVVCSSCVRASVSTAETQIHSHTYLLVEEDG